MIAFIVLGIGCWECGEQTDVLYASTDEESAIQYFERKAAVHHREICDGPNFSPEIESSCFKHAGWIELHKLEMTEVVTLKTTSISPSETNGPPRSDAFWMPDESGEGGDWTWPGRVFFEEGLGWSVQLNKFAARRATDAEIEQAKALDYPERGHAYERAYEAPTGREGS